MAREIAMLATELAHGGAPCLCHLIAPQDRPCIVCDARQYIAEHDPYSLDTRFGPAEDFAAPAAPTEIPAAVWAGAQPLDPEIR